MLQGCGFDRRQWLGQMNWGPRKHVKTTNCRGTPCYCRMGEWSKKDYFLSHLTTQYFRGGRRKINEGETSCLGKLLTLSNFWRFLVEAKLANGLKFLFSFTGSFLVSEQTVFWVNFPRAYDAPQPLSDYEAFWAIKALGTAHSTDSGYARQWECFPISFILLLSNALMHPRSLPATKSQEFCEVGGLILLVWYRQHLWPLAL